MYSLKNFEVIKKFLDEYEIGYTTGNYYDRNDMIIGHWIDINDYLETKELTAEDIEYNNN